MSTFDATQKDHDDMLSDFRDKRCYNCCEKTTYLFADGRCYKCTLLTPEEVRGE